MKVSELAYKAAEYLSAHGHAKGVYTLLDDERNESVCMMGAAMRAMGFRTVVGLGNTAPDINKAWGRLFNTEVEDGLTVPYWNDRNETTKEDAVLKLKEIGWMYEDQGE